MSLLEKVEVPEGKSGVWSVERFEVKEAESMMSFFAYRGRAPHPGWYTRLSCGREVIMSDTPAEMSDHYEPVREAMRLGGSVLINGLGLGMVLKNILLQPNVTDVAVVELSEDVIRLVGPTYETDPRVTIVHADAYTWEPPKGKRYSIVWHDIWPSLCGDNLPEMAKLHRKYGRRCDWQGSWGKRLLEAEKRREGRQSRYAYGW